jgi:hypothetical protein
MRRKGAEAVSFSDAFEELRRVVEEPNRGRRRKKLRKWMRRRVQQINSVKFIDMAAIQTVGKEHADELIHMGKLDARRGIEKLLPVEEAINLDLIIAAIRIQLRALTILPEPKR